MLPFEDTEKEKLYLRREHIILSETAPITDYDRILYQ